MTDERRHDDSLEPSRKTAPGRTVSTVLLLLAIGFGILGLAVVSDAGVAAMPSSVTAFLSLSQDEDGEESSGVDVLRASSPMDAVVERAAEVQPQTPAPAVSGKQKVEARKPSSAGLSSADSVHAHLGIQALSPELRRLRDHVARRYRVASGMLTPLFLAVEEESRRRGIDPTLVVAIIAIESGFNPFAESAAGAQGLMQVIPKWHGDKIAARLDREVHARALFDPVLNVMVGIDVLVEAIERHGDLETALQAYNGAIDDPDRRYARRVLSMKRSLEQIANRQQRG
ncbi:lytic transglycosylase domain-containing protein [Tepidiphilus sp. J10]|uniref:lytic transglycosylase domain-containing protein n=1 Tax=Tepidiphilus sp. J10 TaxID=2502185 RepID=UPI00115DE2C9|nr:transglycosylase SLT domain-containing protein [Tepidiphilus sp. J10]